MLKMYKKAIPVIGIVQLILFIVILFLGAFSSKNVGYNFSWGSGSYFLNFYSMPISVITTTFQLLFYASIFSSLKRLYQNRLRRVKLFAILSAIFYAILITTYIVISVEWKQQDFLNYYSIYTNVAGYLLYILINSSIIIFFLPFLSSLVVSFIAPKYKNETKVRIQKSKTSKDAAEKIRDLKKLFDEGIISKEVFDEKSKKYIEEL